MYYLLIPDAIPTPWTRESESGDLDVSGFNEPISHISQKLEILFAKDSGEALRCYDTLGSGLAAARCLNQRHPQEFLTCVLAIDTSLLRKKAYSIMDLSETELAFVWNRSRAKFPKINTLHVQDSAQGITSLESGCAVVEDHVFALRLQWSLAVDITIPRTPEAEAESPQSAVTTPAEQIPSGAFSFLPAIDPRYIPKQVSVNPEEWELHPALRH